MTTATERADRASIDKFARRRQMLAESALAAIAERGYAQTGLRDIAQHSDLSHGALHYYFDGKDDLIAQAVWDYKSECARRYDDILETALTGDELVRRFADEMVSTMLEETTLHRLWYDLRNQSLFSEGFRPTIIAIDRLLEDMVWAAVSRHCELEGCEPNVDAAMAYALFDGLFQNSLIRHLRADATAVEGLRFGAAELLRRSLGAPTPVV